MALICSHNFTFTQLNSWCDEAGGNITINYLIKSEKQKAAPVDDSNVFWVAFSEAAEES